MSRTTAPTAVLAIDARTARYPGYRISTINRKRIEEPFGWMKTVSPDTTLPS